MGLPLIFRALRWFAYAAIGIGLFFPARANKMTTHEGHTVEDWESPLYLGIDLFFSPVLHLWESVDLMDEFGPEEIGEILVDTLEEGFFWMPITLMAWFLVLYPLGRRIWKREQQSKVWARVALGVTTLGYLLLCGHLFDWATVYDGYYHMGPGGYFLMAGFGMFLLSIYRDLVER